MNLLVTIINFIITLPKLFRIAFAIHNHFKDHPTLIHKLFIGEHPVEHHYYPKEVVKEVEVIKEVPIEKLVIQKVPVEIEKIVELPVKVFKELHFHTEKPCPHCIERNAEIKEHWQKSHDTVKTQVVSHAGGVNHYWA